VLARASSAIAARAFDVHGFDYVGVCEHVAIPREVSSRMSTTWFDAVRPWAAGWHHRARESALPTSSSRPYRHPAQIAKAFSTLDARRRSRDPRSWRWPSATRSSICWGPTMRVGHPLAEAVASCALRSRTSGALVSSVNARDPSSWGTPIWSGARRPPRCAGQASSATVGSPRATQAGTHRRHRRAAPCTRGAGRGDLPFAINSGSCATSANRLGHRRWCLAGAPEVVAAPCASSRVAA